MTRPLALLSFAIFLLASHVAAAKPKVALTTIEGDASGNLREAVAEALESGAELSLIGSKDVNHAVDKLGVAAKLTDKDLRQLATELEADAIVLGKLDEANGTRTLKFRLFIHKKVVKGFTVSFKDAGSEKFRSMLRDKIVDKIASAPADAEDDKAAKQKAVDDAAVAAKKDADAARPATAEVAKPAEAAKPAEVDGRGLPPGGSGAEGRRGSIDGRGLPSGGSGAEGRRGSIDDRGLPPGGDDPRKAKKQVAAAGEPSGSDGVAVRIEPARSSDRPAARLDVGASVVQRTFSFQSNAAANKPQDTSLSAAAGLRIEAELYPLALSRPDSKLANLGLAGDYDHTFGLSVTPKSMATASAPVSQSSYSIGLRYRLALGAAPTSATLTFGLGYGKRTFAPDRAGLTNAQAAADVARDTPSIEYTILDPGLRFRKPLSPRFAIAIGARGLIVTSAGAIQDGTSYGQAQVFGGEVAAALEVMLTRRFALRIAGVFSQVGFSFKGKGDLSNNLDGDPSSKDVSGMSDRSLGGSATLAVVY
jgi:hypothetical protein